MGSVPRLPEPTLPLPALQGTGRTRGLPEPGRLLPPSPATQDPPSPGWGFLSIVRSELIGTRSGETGRRRGFVSGWSCARVPAGWRGSPQVCTDAAGGAAYGGAPWARGMSLARLGLPSAGFTIWHQLAPRRCPAANQTPVLPLPWRSAAILSSSHYLGSGFSHGVPGGWEKGPWGFVSSSRYPSSESPHRYAIFKNTASGGLVSVRLCAKYSPCHLRWLRSQ